MVFVTPPNGVLVGKKLAKKLEIPRSD